MLVSNARGNNQSPLALSPCESDLFCMGLSSVCEERSAGNSAGAAFLLFCSNDYFSPTAFLAVVTMFSTVRPMASRR